MKEKGDLRELRIPREGGQIQAQGQLKKNRERKRRKDNDVEEILSNFKMVETKAGTLHEKWGEGKVEKGNLCPKVAFSICEKASSSIMYFLVDAAKESRGKGHTASTAP